MVSIKSLTAGIACLAVANAEVFHHTNLHSNERRQGLSFDYNSEKVRGVNLGGWFVLEPWITPSIFDGWADSKTVVDEYTYTQTLGQDEASSRLTIHWNTWITQADFIEIKAAGLNHVRIPIGYWALLHVDGDPYVQGQLPVLDRAIVWARELGLKVMLDLHGAPGSQNGFDNSGRLGDVTWQSGSEYNVHNTLWALQALSDRYKGDGDVVTAIELLNEPLGGSLDLSALKKFYYDGWGDVRSDNADTAVVIHDAFQDYVSYWNGFMDGQSGVNNVIVDHHDYQVFDYSQVSMSPSDHISTACAVGNKVKQTDKWLVVGEWTGAQTDCAKWLNGLGKGARYDGTFEGTTGYGNCDNKYEGSVADMLEVDKTNLAMFVEAQLDAFEQHTGWIFWAWKTESAPEWHFRDLVKNGLIPQPLTARKYGNQCGY
ncbi:MAG: exo-1,3-beta-glucanase [Claussenomyces sp. TS43310]|nr:MAG: exo-1,3-beta-glucanase [Claussenomyces sp. TS43310]